MRISNYPTDTLTGTELILATDVNTSTQEYKTVNFSVDTLKTFLVGTDDTNEFTDIVLGGSLKFEGTANAHETTLGAVDPTADATLNLPAMAAGTYHIPVLAATSATAITSTPEELNLLDNVSGLVQADFTKLAAVDATATELNILDGVTATTAEVNYLDITALGTVEVSKVVTADANGDVLFPEDAKLDFGAGGDLKIYHDGDHSRIKDTGTGHLIMNATDFIVNNSNDSENMIIATDGGAVTLFCDGTGRIATTSTGVSVTGTITSTLGITGTTGTFSGAVTGASYTGGAISGTTGTFSGNVTATQVKAETFFGGTSEDLADGAAASLTKTLSYLTTGGAETATLAAGTEGQIKMFSLVTANGGDMVITVTNAGWKSSGTGTITFTSNVGIGCTLMYANSKWCIVGNHGCGFA